MVVEAEHFVWDTLFWDCLVELFINSLKSLNSKEAPGMQYKGGGIQIWGGGSTAQLESAAGEPNQSSPPSILINLSEVDLSAGDGGTSVPYDP